MRTSLKIDDDVLKAAKKMAKRREVSVGEVISALARRALQGPLDYLFADDFPVFKVRKNAVSFGPEEVRKALEEY